MLHVSFPLSLLTTYIIFSDTKPLLIEYHDPFTENPNTQTQDTLLETKRISLKRKHFGRNHQEYCVNLHAFWYF